MRSLNRDEYEKVRGLIKPAALYEIDRKRDKLVYVTLGPSFKDRPYIIQCSIRTFQNVLNSTPLLTQT